MLRRFTRKSSVALAGLLVGTLSAAAPAQAQEGEAIRMGWTAWSDAEVVTRVAQQVLEERLGYDVELILADIGLQYQGIAEGDLDVMLLAWLPTTHAPYWEKVSDQVEDLGTIYTGGRNGWIVPAYVPESELKGIPDLNKPEVQERLDATIQGIDPGSGIMQLSEEALEEYDLDGYTLLSASDAAMVTALENAIRRDEWIVVTGWRPHWKFFRYDLRFLEDPKGLLGGEEEVHGLARQGFREDFPRAAAFLENYKLPLEDLEEVMYEATQSSYEEAVAAYIESHPDLVDQWVEPAMDKPLHGS